MGVYDEHRGTYLGSRVTKNCNTCKVHEHYGYWTTSGKRQFETDCLENDFLSSSEDTAVGLDLSTLHPYIFSIYGIERTMGSREGILC